MHLGVGKFNELKLYCNCSIINYQWVLVDPSQKGVLLIPILEVWVQLWAFLWVGFSISKIKVPLLNWSGSSCWKSCSFFSLFVLSLLVFLGNKQKTLSGSLLSSSESYLDFRPLAKQNQRCCVAIIAWKTSCGHVIYETN